MRPRLSLKIHSKRMETLQQCCRQPLLSFTQNKLQSGVLLLVEVSALQRWLNCNQAVNLVLLQRATFISMTRSLCVI